MCVFARFVVEKSSFFKVQKNLEDSEKKTEISGEPRDARRRRQESLPTAVASKASRGRGGEGTIPARCPESERGPYVLDKVEGIGIGRVLRHS